MENVLIKITQKTYQQIIYDSRLFELAKEAGFIYTTTLQEFWNIYNTTKLWLSPFDLINHMSQEKLLSKDIKLLGYNSYQGSIQLVSQNLKAWKEAKKEYSKNPSKFSGIPKPPSKDKFFSPIIFKDDQIRVKKKYLLLSLKKGNSPIKIKWSLTQPVYATIIWNKSKGWLLNTVFEDETLQLENLKKENTLSIDLGSKRVATTFDGKETITYNGKPLKSLIHLQNKLQGKTSTKLSKTKFGSRRNNKIRRAKRKVQLRISNKKKDILHKYSKHIVDNAIVKNIGTIVFGDCASIHDKTNLGKVNNQQVQQSPEQQLRKYVTYKFESIGGAVKIVPENYTSQTCPSCGNLHKPKDRTYICPKCDFTFDRDGVGAINIFKNVSSEKLDVLGNLTMPKGLKYNPNCLSAFA